MRTETTEPAAEASAPRNELQQKVRQLEESLEARNDELATAEAQRDEAHMRLRESENHLLLSRTLHRMGVVDAEAATLLLGRRMDLCEPVAEEDLDLAVEKLLLDKPFLRASSATNMPPPTRTGHDSDDGPAARLNRLAERAVASGSRRDVVEFLRMRRATMK